MKQGFSEALHEKKIPILTLDNKWYRLLDDDTRKRLSGTEERLNALLRRQGKLNTETKDIRKLKKKLMDEIMSMAEQMNQGGSSQLEEKLAQHKRLLEGCNEKLADYQEELRELPGEIEELNSRLMLATMEYCYSMMQTNSEEIEKIAEWVKDIRIELKKQLVRKQKMEQKNQQIYSYMHDVFGADVVDLFDMKYYPEERGTAEPDN